MSIPLLNDEHLRHLAEALSTPENLFLVVPGGPLATAVEDIVKEILRDHVLDTDTRMEHAERRLRKQRDEHRGPPAERARLEGKRQGVALARDYLRTLKVIVMEENGDA